MMNKTTRDKEPVDDEHHGFSRCSSAVRARSSSLGCSPCIKMQRARDRWQLVNINDQKRKISLRGDGRCCNR